MGIAAGAGVRRRWRQQLQVARNLKLPPGRRAWKQRHGGGRGSAPMAHLALGGGGPLEQQDHLLDLGVHRCGCLRAGGAALRRAPRPRLSASCQARSGPAAAFRRLLQRDHPNLQPLNFPQRPALVSRICARQQACSPRVAERVRLDLMFAREGEEVIYRCAHARKAGDGRARQFSAAGCCWTALHSACRIASSQPGSLLQAPAAAYTCGRCLRARDTQPSPPTTQQPIAPINNARAARPAAGANAAGLAAPGLRSPAAAAAGRRQRAALSGLYPPPAR